MRLQEVLRQSSAIDVVVAHDAMQIRIGLLEDLMHPVGELDVRIAAHLAKHRRALEGAVRELVELSKERHAADFGLMDGNRSFRSES